MKIYLRESSVFANRSFSRLTKKRKSDLDDVETLNFEMENTRRDLGKAAEVWEKARAEVNSLAQEVRFLC